MDYTERKLIQLNASVVESAKIACSYWVQGNIGQQMYASKPTGMLLDPADYHDTDFANAFIAQQLPNASVQILWLKRGGPDG